MTFVLACEELARGSGGLSSIFITTVSLAIAPIVMFGNAEQKAKYIPRVANEGATVAFALTEAMAGSDVANMDMKYRRRLLHPQWHEDIHHKRRRGRLSRNLRDKRQGTGIQGHQRLHHRQGYARIFRRQA